MLRTSDKRLLLGARLDDIVGIPFASQSRAQDKRIISPAMPEFGSSAAIVRAFGADSSSGSWVTANTALAIPFSLSNDLTLTHLGWKNGSAAGGNHDIGIYRAEDWSLVGSTGSTAGSGSSAIQSVAVSIGLPRGHYYLAKVIDATTTNRIRWFGTVTSALVDVICGYYLMASAFPLPATLTPTLATGTWRVPDVFMAARTPL